MLSRGAALRSLRTTWPALRPALTYRSISTGDIDDPNMNGGYVDPPRVPRQFRDPREDWWDKQERRNYGEPLHEDNDVLGIFTPHVYTHTPPGKGALQVLTFVGAVFGLYGLISFVYPDKPTVPREFPGDLESELGGPGAVSAKQPVAQ